MAGEAAHLQQLAASAPFSAGMYDYRAAPLGSQPGEEGLSTPYNQTAADAVVRVRNLSASVKRRIIKEYVSGWDGGERSVKEGPYKGQPMTPRELQDRVIKGFNENWETEQVSPQDIVLTHNRQKYLIPAYATDPETGKQIEGDAPEVIVPPGMWDLYMGNFERMHSRDIRERTDEMQNVASRGLNRFVIAKGNPYGFLQFSREEMRVTSTVVDRDRIDRGEILEV